MIKFHINLKDSFGLYRLTMASNKKCADGQQVKYKRKCLFNENVLLRLLFKIFFILKSLNRGDTSLWKTGVFQSL